MKFRRTVVIVLLVGLLGVLSPTVGEAGMLGRPEISADHFEPGLVARFLEWVGAAFEQVTQVFVAQEGASILPGG